MPRLPTRLVRRSSRVLALACLALSLQALPAGSQEALTGPVDFNRYYRFPLSLGAGYRSLSPLSGWAPSFRVSDLSAELRVPVPGSPSVQPFLRGGVLTFDSLDPDEPLAWDHYDPYLGLGLALAFRFARNFELGVDLSAGFALAVYPDLLPDYGPVSTRNLLLQAGGHLGLDPSYGLCVDLSPSIQYQSSLDGFGKFDGFSIGLGLSLAFRLGQDPDAARPLVRSIRIVDISLPPAFAAMQSWYARNALGEATIENVEGEALSDLSVSFFQAGFMDSPTPCATIPRLEPKAEVRVDLLASFNDRVFTTEGVTPLTGEIKVAYTSRGQAVEQAQAVSYDLHDKTAITWDDTRKAAAFVTPSDSALRNYSSFVRQACREALVAACPAQLQLAMELYGALAELGIIYQSDPVLPFQRAQGNAMAVDSISLPRDSLARGSGDCDDLAVLYCGLLESAGAETALVTTPGHIFAAVNTGLASREWKSLHPDRAMSIELEGRLWVPVEVTLVASGGFLEAWRTAAGEWAALGREPERRGFYPVRAAQETFRPVGLREVDLGLQYGSREGIRKRFQDELDRLYALLEREAAARVAGGAKEDLNRLGILRAQYRRYELAADCFRAALASDPGYTAARVNLANLLFMQGDYASALAAYREVLAAMDGQGAAVPANAARLLVNMAQACDALDLGAEAQALVALAGAIDPSLAERYATLGVPVAGGAQAATAPAGGPSAASRGESAAPRAALFAGEDDGHETP